MRFGLVLLVVLAVWGGIANWFVHHPRRWHAEWRRSMPTLVSAPLYWMGNPLGDITDALGWTGHDSVYEYDCPAPAGQVFFAGAPRRIGPPAPDDIRTISRGEFAIGWSDKLRHPAWCAYHVCRNARFESLKRPGFTLDRSIPSAPHPSDYRNSGYDRGHLAPNYAIVTRYGEAEQKKTFQMSNVAPQSPALNRGVWRDVEHRIADLWTARYGEIWVIVGSISNVKANETLPGTDIDIPTRFYQLIVAQDNMEVRTLAVVFSQRTPWNAWAARNIVTIDELEEMTGLDFLPELPSFIQDPIEADLPTRLWPIRARDILKLVMIRFR